MHWVINIQTSVPPVDHELDTALVGCDSWNHGAPLNTVHEQSCWHKYLAEDTHICISGFAEMALYLGVAPPAVVKEQFSLLRNLARDTPICLQSQLCRPQPWL